MVHRVCASGRFVIQIFGCMSAFAFLCIEGVPSMLCVCMASLETHGTLNTVIVEECG